MKVHELKTIQPFFDDVFYNRKDFEVRKNDRNFEVGDRLKLVEFGHDIKNPRFVLKDIKYILLGGQYGIAQDYVILGLKDIFPQRLSLNDCTLKSLEQIKSSVEAISKVSKKIGCILPRPSFPANR